MYVTDVLLAIDIVHVELSDTRIYIHKRYLQIIMFPKHYKLLGKLIKYEYMLFTAG